MLARIPKQAGELPVTVSRLFCAVVPPEITVRLRQRIENLAFAPGRPTLIREQIRP